MSSYTISVRNICETYNNSEDLHGFNSVNKIIDTAYPKIFDFDFPIFDESYRKILCTKIIRHYYTREIGDETVGLWKLRLEQKLNLIMPYYNQLYRSELYEFNPLYDVEIIREGNKKHDGTNEGIETSKRTSSGKSRGDDFGSSSTEYLQEVVDEDRYCETPQGELSPMLESQYLTNARGKRTNNTQDSVNKFVNGNTATFNTNDDTTNTQNNTVNNVDEYFEKVYGKQGGISYSQLIKEFRTTFLNIDAQIIEELSDLFFNLW